MHSTRLDYAGPIEVLGDGPSNKVHQRAHSFRVNFNRDHQNLHSVHNICRMPAHARIYLIRPVRPTGRRRRTTGVSNLTAFKNAIACADPDASTIPTGIQSYVERVCACVGVCVAAVCVAAHAPQLRQPRLKCDIL